MSVLSRADVKSGSKNLAEILKEKYKIDIKHGHALAIISKALGFRDWHTLSAMIGDTQEAKVESTAKPTDEPTTVGELLELLKLHPPTTPLFAEYEYQEDNFDRDGGYSAQGRKRTQGIQAFMANDGFILEFENPLHWKTLRERSQSFPGGEVQSKGLDLESEIERIIDLCETLKGRDDQHMWRDGAEFKISQRYKFIENDEIYKADSELLNEYGVTWSWDKEDGVQVSELEDADGRPYGDLEGLIETLRNNFRNAHVHEAFQFFEHYGLLDVSAEWESDKWLVVTSTANIHDAGFEKNFLGLLVDVFGFDEKKEMEAAGDLAAQLELDKRRGK